MSQDDFQRLRVCTDVCEVLKLEWHYAVLCCSQSSEQWRTESCTGVRQEKTSG